MSTSDTKKSQPSGHARRSNETQRRLLDATISLIAEVGWHGISNRAVAGRAGVNLALIRYHFNDQAGLMDAALHEAVARLKLPEPPPTETPPTLRALLGDLILSVPDATTREASRVLLAATTAAIFDEALAARVRPLLHELRARLAAVAALDPRHDDQNRDLASGQATLAAALLDGLMLHALLDPDTDLTSAARAITHTSTADPTDG